MIENRIIILCLKKKTICSPSFLSSTEAIADLVRFHLQTKFAMAADKCNKLLYLRTPVILIKFITQWQAL